MSGLDVRRRRRAVLCLLTATLLFALFDGRVTAQGAPPAYGTPAVPAQGQPYGYPYGR